MRPWKRGFALPPELFEHVWEYHKIAGISLNAVGIRLLRIAIQDLVPFTGDRAALKALLTDPWETIQQLPALKREMEKRAHGRLISVTATRITIPERNALGNLANEKHTTVSAIHRQALRRILATEAA